MTATSEDRTPFSCDSDLNAAILLFLFFFIIAIVGMPLPLPPLLLVFIIVLLPVCAFPPGVPPAHVRIGILRLPPQPRLRGDRADHKPPIDAHPHRTRRGIRTALEPGAPIPRGRRTA